MASIPDNVLDDVLSRFVLPEHKQGGDSIRLCFAIEMGFWFYLDTIRALDPALPECTIESFAKRCFRYFPQLLKRSEHPEMVLRQWRDFKRMVPVYGAIMINPKRDKMLLVEGNSTKGCWTFPRGKIEENEDHFECATREVMEETSFDISRLGSKDFFIEKICSERVVRLYVVYGVPETTLFFPKVKGEIASHRWFNIADLPGSPTYSYTVPSSGRRKEQFYMVQPFVKEILKKFKKEKSKGRSNSYRLSESDHTDDQGRALLSMMTKGKPAVKSDPKPIQILQQPNTISLLQQPSPITLLQQQTKQQKPHSAPPQQGQQSQQHQPPLQTFQQPPKQHQVYHPQPRHPIIFGANKHSNMQSNNIPLNNFFQPPVMRPPPSTNFQPPVIHSHPPPQLPAPFIRPESSPKRNGGGARRGRGRRGVSTMPQSQSLANFQLDLKPLLDCLPDRRVRV